MSEICVDKNLNLLANKRATRPKLSYGTNGIYDREAFYNYCRKHWDYSLIFVSYSISSNFPDIKIERGVYCIASIEIEDDRVRQLGGVHTKLYIFKKHKRIVACFLGSLNVGADQSLELLVKLDKSQFQWALDYFEELWKQAK